MTAGKKEKDRWKFYLPSPGAWALLPWGCWRAATPPVRGRDPAEPDMPPELDRQWENFLSYTGRPEEGCGHED